ncbi:MAG: hypothetical protein SXG53_28580, partial [Pseudomonadota bacterium]|nr:hypothetical protein [Pseudomonadota bacterium]
LGAVPTVEEADELVSAGNIEELERRLHSLIATHETETPERESVHWFFQQFSHVPEDGLRITERWVQLAPDSALAAIARGNALKGAGWEARGGKWARLTSDKKMRLMSSYFDQAEEQFRSAIASQPSWTFGYAGLMDIGKADRDEVGDWAFEQASAIDPGCGEIAYRRMQSLEPRWGGSWEAMQAYAGQLAHHVERRPLLANQMSEPYTDFMSIIDKENRYTPEGIAMLELAVQTSGLEEGLHAAADAIMNPSVGEPDISRGIAMLLQHSRFQPVNAWAERAIGRYLLERDPAWAKAALERAVAEDPDNARGRYYLGAANYETGDFAAAEPHYLAAAESADYRAEALVELAEMWLFSAGLDPAEGAAKAQPYVERLLTAYPRDADGRYLRVAIKAAGPDGKLDVALIHDFLEVVDRNKPRQERRRAALSKVLDVLEKGSGEVSIMFE